MKLYFALFFAFCYEYKICFCSLLPNDYSTIAYLLISYSYVCYNAIMSLDIIEYLLYVYITEIYLKNEYCFYGMISLLLLIF